MIKAKTNNLNKPEDGNYGKDFNYICKDHDINVCFQPGFFDTLAGNFMASDTITCIKIIKERVVSRCKGIILEVQINGNVRRVDFAPLGDIEVFAGKHLTIEEEKKIPAPLKYIKSNGEFKWNPGKQIFQIYEDKKLVHETREKQDAIAIARGDLAIPAAA